MNVCYFCGTTASERYSRYRGYVLCRMCNNLKNLESIDFSLGKIYNQKEKKEKTMKNSALTLALVITSLIPTYSYAEQCQTPGWVLLNNGGCVPANHPDAQNPYLNSNLTVSSAPNPNFQQWNYSNTEPFELGKTYINPYPGMQLHVASAVTMMNYNGDMLIITPIFFNVERKDCEFCTVRKAVIQASVPRGSWTEKK